MMKKLFAMFLALTLSVSLLAGCGGKEDTPTDTKAVGEGQTEAADAGQEDGKTEGKTTFTIALDSDIVALDPAFAYDFTTNPVVNQITQGLLTFDENNELVPQLASSWEATDDTTYVYQIRDDVTFSDGSPMTMDDVLFSIERIMNPDTASYLLWMFDNVESVEQTGDWELTVHLKEPSASWKYIFATTAGHVISKSYYEANQDTFGTAEGGLVGTGPYVFDSWQSGQEIVLKRNENYWDKDQTIAMDTLVFKIIPEDTTRVTALQTGEVDFTANTPADLLDTLKADENLNVQDVETMGVVFLAFNTERAPFNDVNVRKAVASAIDLKSIHDNIVKDAGQEGGCLPSSSTLFTINPDEWTSYVEGADACSYDVEKAKEYLAQSDYADGFDCNMIISEDSMRYSMALAIQEYLKELNINVELVRVSADEHTSYQFGGVFDADGNRDYDMIMAGWEADYPDVASNIEPLFAAYNAGEGGSNAAVYQNDEVDALIRKQSASLDDAARNQDLFAVMDQVNADTPYVFLTYPNRQTTMNKAFTGYTMNASWIWNMFFKDIRPAE